MRVKAEWGTCSQTVSLDTHTLTLAYWNNVIAIGSGKGDIITLDAITGSRVTVLSGHTDEVNCVTSSSDGRSLVSGADDNTVKLWDIQTGGVVRTFLGHCHERNSGRSPNVLVGPGVKSRVQLAAIDCRSVACVLEG